MHTRHNSTPSWARWVTLLTGAHTLKAKNVNFEGCSGLRQHESKPAHELGTLCTSLRSFIPKIVFNLIVRPRNGPPGSCPWNSFQAEILEWGWLTSSGCLMFPTFRKWYSGFLPLSHLETKITQINANFYVNVISIGKR